MIVAAAISIDDEDSRSITVSLPRPARHNDIDRALIAFAVTLYDQRTYGFITDDGQFLNRVEAMLHARECKQLQPRNQPNDPIGAKPRISTNIRLYSEDLW